MSEKDINNLEGMSHIEQVDYLLEKRFKPIERNLNIFYIAVLGVVGYLFINQQNISEKVNTKADKSEVVTKFEYYQIEKDEHRMVLEIFAFPSRAAFVLGQINDNMESALGFKYTSRSSKKDESN